MLSHFWSSSAVNQFFTVMASVSSLFFALTLFPVSQLLPNVGQYWASYWAVAKWDFDFSGGVIPCNHKVQSFISGLSRTLMKSMGVQWVCTLNPVWFSHTQEQYFSLADGTIHQEQFSLATNELVCFKHFISLGKQKHREHCALWRLRSCWGIFICTFEPVYIIC